MSGLLPALAPCPDCHGVGWVMDGGGRDAGARGPCGRCDGRAETLIQKKTPTHCGACGERLERQEGVEHGIPADAKVLELEVRPQWHQVVLHMDRPVETPTLRWRKVDP